MQNRVLLSKSLNYIIYKVFKDEKEEKTNILQQTLQSLISEIYRNSRVIIILSTFEHLSFVCKSFL